MCTDAESPGVMSPKLHANIWFGAAPEMSHVPGPEYPGLIDQLTPSPAGSGSERVTDRAMPVSLASLFETVTVKPIGFPASTGVASAVLVIASSGARTTIVADASTSGWLAADAVAVFGYVPALAAVVLLRMCTDAESPGAMSPKLHESDWLGAPPVMSHVPGPGYAGSIDQLTPSPCGSGSERVTDRAVPVLPLSAFDTVIVKPIGSPVFTGVASAVFVIASSGQSTVVDADAVNSGWFVALTVAVFG